MTANAIIESFSWLTDEYKTADVGPNKVRIKGVALKSDIVSRNNRKYVDEEIEKSGRTLIGKPITINHNSNMIVGNVEWAEPEEGLLEYVAVVSKQPYVTMLREHDKRIKGVSVEADYLHAKCTHCGKRFQDIEKFTQHMIEEEHIRNFQVEPHQILMKALSLVVDPEVPGVPDTTVQLMETFRDHGLLQLYESITSDKIEMEKLKEANVSVQPEKHITPNIAAVTKEKEEKPTTSTLPSPPPVKEAPKPPAAQELKVAEPCSPELKACVDALIADGKPEENAWAICRSKIGETIKIKESANLPTLELIPEGYPYESAEEYIRETGKSRKEWARECDQVDIRNRNNRKMVEFYNQHVLPILNSELVVTVPKDDLSWKEAISNIPKDDLSWKEHVDKHPQDDLSWKEHVEHPADDMSWKPELAKLATFEATITELAAVQKQLTEGLAKQKADYETILAGLDGKFVEYKKTMETRLQEMKTEAQVKADAKLKEIQGLEAKIQELTKKTEETAIVAENADAKITGKFKGKAAAATTSNAAYDVNPLTGK